MCDIKCIGGYRPLVSLLHVCMSHMHDQGGVTCLVSHTHEKETL